MFFRPKIFNLKIAFILLLLRYHFLGLINEHILFLNPKDLLIVFSFPPYSKETIDAAEYAHKRKIDVTLLQNSDFIVQP